MYVVRERRLCWRCCQQRAIAPAKQRGILARRGGAARFYDTLPSHTYICLSTVEATLRDANSDGADAASEASFQRR